MHQYKIVIFKGGSMEIPMPPLDGEYAFFSATEQALQSQIIGLAAEIDKLKKEVKKLRQIVSQRS